MRTATAIALCVASGFAFARGGHGGGGGGHGGGSGSVGTVHTGSFGSGGSHNSFVPTATKGSLPSTSTIRVVPGTEALTGIAVEPVLTTRPNLTEPAALPVVTTSPGTTVIHVYGPAGQPLAAAPVATTPAPRALPQRATPPDT
jgi:hypothetical protein